MYRVYNPRAFGDDLMIIRGHFICDVPYFAAHLRFQGFEGVIWFFADTGAARTTLLDRDVGYIA